METYYSWFKIFLFRQLRNPLYYLQLFVMALAIYIIGSISFPDKDELCIGIMYENNEAKEEYDEIIRSKESAEVIIYDDEELLKSHISSQRVDCGFVIPEQVDETNQIKYFYSPFTRMGELEKENIFSAVYELMSKNILIMADEQIYGDTDEERLNYLLTKNEELLNYEQVVTIDYEKITGIKGEKVSENNVYTVQGIAGLFLMLTIILGGVSFSQSNNAGNFLQAVSKKISLRIQLMNDLAIGLIPIVIALLSVMISGKSRGFAIELSGLIAMAAYLELWLFFIRKTMRANRKDIEQQHIWAVILVLIQLLICPVFVNLADKLTIMKYVSLISPLGLFFFI